MLCVRGLHFAVAVTLAWAAAGHAAELRHFSFAYDQPRTTAHGMLAGIFADKLSELSQGSVVIDQFPGAQLGLEPQALQKLRAGEIDFAVSSTTNAAALAPEAAVFSLHYLFRSEEHLKTALADPALNQATREMVGARVQGARVLALGTQGFRNIYGKREVRRVEDLSGVKIRVQTMKIEDTMFPAYRAQVAHIAFAEVAAALQAGTVEAAENRMSVYLSNKHYEAAPVLSFTQHVASNSLLWISDKAWNRLGDEQKQWVRAAADAVARDQPAKALKLEADAAVRLERLGVKLVKDVDKSGFVALAQPIQDQLAQELGPSAVKILGLVRRIN